MKIGIFGGRFDPIHVGHLINMVEIKEEFSLDKILFLVSYSPPHKGVEADFQKRVEMIRLSIRDDHYFEVSEIERDIEGPSYTVKVLEKMKSIYPEDQFFFIMGSDEIKIIHTWFKYRELFSLARVIVMRRPGNLDYRTEFDVMEASNSLIDLSSSEIRKRIKKGKSIRYMVPDRVREYIERNHLYR